MTTADRQTDVDATGQPLDDTARRDTGGYTRHDDATGYDGTGPDPAGAHRHDVAPDQGSDHDSVPSQDERHLDEHAGQRTEAHRLDADPDSDPSRYGVSDPTVTDAAAADDTTAHRDQHGDTTYDGTADSTRTGGYADRQVDESAGGTADVDATTDRDRTGPAHVVHDSHHGTGTGTAAATTATGRTGDGTPSAAGGGTGRERLVPADRVQDYTSRWDAVKGEFVDEPRQAVAKADKLVGELLDELDQLFRKQRSDLEHGLDTDQTSTEDLRLALRRYRSFFDRLLEL